MSPSDARLHLPFQRVVATSSQWGNQGGNVCPLVPGAEKKRGQQASERLVPFPLTPFFSLFDLQGNFPAEQRKNDGMDAGGIGGAWASSDDRNVRVPTEGKGKDKLWFA